MPQAGRPTTIVGQLPSGHPARWRADGAGGRIQRDQTAHQPTRDRPPRPDRIRARRRCPRPMSQADATRRARPYPWYYEPLNWLLLLLAHLPLTLLYGLAELIYGVLAYGFRYRWAGGDREPAKLISRKNRGRNPAAGPGVLPPLCPGGG